MPDVWLPPVSGFARGTPFGKAGKMWSSGHHTGLDFPCPDGTPVMAVGSGVVIYAGNTHGAYGIQVKIRHKPGLETWYCHLSSVSVRKGQTIVAGGVQVGSSGHTGNVTGPHLHLEFRVNGTAVDPAPYLDGKKGAATAARNPETGKPAPTPKPGKAERDWSTKVAPAPDAVNAADTSNPLPAVAGVTLETILILGGFGLVAIGALYAASPAIKKGVADANAAAMQAAEVAFPEVGMAAQAAGAAGGAAGGAGSTSKPGGPAGSLPKGIPA